MKSPSDFTKVICDDASGHIQYESPRKPQSVSRDIGRDECQKGDRRSEENRKRNKSHEKRMPEKRWSVCGMGDMREQYARRSPNTEIADRREDRKYRKPKAPYPVRLDTELAGEDDIRDQDTDKSNSFWRSRPERFPYAFGSQESF